ncbi:MAG: hypothetical protein ACK4UK_00600 [Flavobacterium sp.]
MKNLDEEIAFWEKRQHDDVADLKQHFSITTESFKPSKIIKSSVLSFITSDTVKSKSVGMVIGFLAQKLLIGRSENKMKQVLSLVVYDAVIFLTEKFMTKQPSEPKSS